MKLGRLLLAGLRRRTKPSARKKAAPSKKRLTPIRATRSAPSTPARVPARRTPAPAVSTPSTAGELAGIPRVLSSSTLVRPSDELRQSMEAFLLDQRSEHTRVSYGKDLKRFLKFLILRRSERGEEAIDRSLIIAYKEFLLSDGLEHTTVDRHLATLRSFFRWLVDDGRIERSPVEGVRFLKPRRLSSTIGFTDDEVRKVLGLPDIHTRTGAQHHAILTVLFYSGLRRSELCALRTSNLGVERGFPVLRLRGKGNAERIVALAPAAVRSLQHYLKVSRKDPTTDQILFSPIRNNRTGTTEKPLDPSMIFYIVTRYARLAGVANRVSPHSCRATAISNARDHNVSDRAIQEFAGWASPDMITRYDKRRSAVEKSASLAIRYGAEHETPGDSAAEQGGPPRVTPDTVSGA